MLHFHPLTVKEIRKETPECISLSFDIPETLKEKFLFRHGQSLTMRMQVNGQEVRRTYSLCSSPLDNEWRVAVKKVTGGLFSSFANENIKVGDIVEVMPPVGNFHTRLDPAQKKNYLAFAAGSGITPILSIIKTSLLTEPESNFTLIYGNRSRASIIFKEELEALKNKFMKRLTIHHILSREQTDSAIYHGRINKEKCALLFDKLINLGFIDDFFLCGPEEMIFSVKEFLTEKGIDKKKIHFELFTTPGEKFIGSRKAEQSAIGNEGPKSRIKVKLDGILFEFDLPKSGDSILDAALSKGADLPFACKGGVCCTCKAKLVEGEVLMDVNYGLEEDEIEKGFILTCQSHPTTDIVVVDFDQR